MAKIAVAPNRLSGDGIELSPLNGKLVAVYPRSRETKNTKYGERSMTHVLLACADSKPGTEPLEGIMFQTYFQGLKLDQWYVGVVGKVSSGRNDAWVLTTEKIDQKKLEEFAKVLEKIELPDTRERFL